MSSIRIFGVGPGLFLLLFLAAAVILACVWLSQSEQSSLYIFLLTCGYAILVSIILALPKSNADDQATQNLREIRSLGVTDSGYYLRLALVGCSGIMLTLALIGHLVFHIMSPVYASTFHSAAAASTRVSSRAARYARPWISAAFGPRQPAQ
ncbi:hypothetical protein GGF32_003095 [Allomyces javanicus]|nr:hypothetical protein GGF32_003081 [Allomyces javanicus]KAJ3353425.1 hypothetical protein GGF32_003095 [Allomyces javanicus]